MSFPAYLEYRDSGIEWPKKVPTKWIVSRLKYLGIAKIGLTYTPDEVVNERTSDSKIVLRSSNVQAGQIHLENTVYVEKEVPDSLLTRAGDILICSRNGSRALIGKNAVIPMHLSGQTFGAFMTVFRSPINDYLRWIFASQLFETQSASYLTATINQLTVGNLNNFEVPVPPPEEQRAIASFLDSETSKIDALVAEQRRLIELLKEKRQAVISHAVTKGLNPNAKMKPSGIEWLGEVPAHWDVRRVKAVSTFVTSGPRGWSERITEKGALFIQSGDLNDSLGIEFAQAKRVSVVEDADAGRTQLFEGDVVVCITGARTGNVALSESQREPAYVNQHLCLIRSKPDVLPLFLAIGLKGHIGQIHFAVSQYGLKQGLSLENVKECPVPLPPIKEQKSIVNHVLENKTKLEALTAQSQRTIELLQERRTAIISAAVTGKIDVRNYEDGVT